MSHGAMPRTTLKDMRAAVVHYWLLNRRGGEKVLEAICRILPDADVFTLFLDPATLGPELRRHRITASLLDPLRRWHRSLLPLMPLALESFDLRGYDLVVSSESGPAKGVILPASTRHICYCHTPMRYLWELYAAYRTEWTSSPWKRAVMAPLANYLRLWDYASAARVDHFLANSRNVQNRIWKTYRRRSDVLYPPVEVESFYWKPAEDYYLIVAELVPYKRFDSLVRVFSRTGRRLRIAGSGPDYRRLRGMASANVEFLGRVSDEDLRELYARCRAFLLPGEEDFGMTAVEAQASGKPVIALGRGGVLESVPSYGGVFYEAPSDDALSLAVERFELREGEFVPADLQAAVSRFSEAEFRRGFTEMLNGTATPDDDRDVRVGMLPPRPRRAMSRV
jgi:glycosyltransferase involved in cell wall biosynthesis